MRKDLDLSIGRETSQSKLASLNFRNLGQTLKTSLNSNKPKNLIQSRTKLKSIRTSAERLKFVSGGGLEYSSQSSKRKMTSKGLEIACLIPAPKKSFKFDPIK